MVLPMLFSSCMQRPLKTQSFKYWNAGKGRVGNSSEALLIEQVRWECLPMDGRHCERIYLWIRASMNVQMSWHIMYVTEKKTWIYGIGSGYLKDHLSAITSAWLIQSCKVGMLYILSIKEAVSEGCFLCSSICPMEKDVPKIWWPTLCCCLEELWALHAGLWWKRVRSFTSYLPPFIFCFIDFTVFSLSVMCCPELLIVGWHASLNPPVPPAASAPDVPPPPPQWPYL